MRPFKSTVLTVLTAVMLSTPISLVAYTLLNPPPPHVVSFDLKRAIKKYSSNLAYYLPQTGIDLTGILDKKAIIYAQILEEELAYYAQESNVVILVQGAIINGAIDITPEIEKRAITRMNLLGTTQ